MYAKAIYVDGKIVTGRHHGEAFGLLSESEKCSDSLLSGFYDEQTGRFFDETCSFYTKSIYLVRHGRPSKGYDEDEDPDVCQEGIEAAHHVASFLEKEGASHYCGYTSPFLRCLITADIISRCTGICFTVDPWLIEPPEGDTVLENHAHEFPQFNWPTCDEFRMTKQDASAYSSRVKVIAESLNPVSVVVTHYTPINCLARLVSGCQELVGETLPMGSVTHISNNKIVLFGKQI